MRFLAVILLMLPGSLLLADEVALKNGGKLSGIVTEKKDSIVVEMGVGCVEVSKEEVLTVTPGRTPLHEFRERRAAVGEKGTAAQEFELAVFARTNGLHKQAREGFQRVIEKDPSHEGARRALGYRLHRGRWMTESEVNQEMGFVLFEGKWLTPAEVELIRNRRLELAERRLEEKRRREDREAEERERKLAWDRLYQERLERLREEQRNRSPREGQSGYSGRDFGYRSCGYSIWDAIPTLDLYTILRRVPIRTPVTILQP